MKILVINAGSSSIKFQLIESTIMFCLYKGIVEIPPEKSGKTGPSLEGTWSQYYQGIKFIADLLAKEKIIKNPSEIRLIGHRVVHGGEEYKKPTVITAKVLKKIQDLCSLAPLHNPANMAGIRACQKIFPKAKNVAVFDTAFYSAMPEKAYLYALPYYLYKNKKIRRYGFHGTSHEYVTRQALELIAKSGGRASAKSAKIVSCHMGNGVSITASINGKAIDTSMGFTPLEGIPMGTRCGDIDPFIPIHLQKKLGMSVNEVDTILNHKSGFFGICGKSNMKDIWTMSQKGNRSAKLAIEILAYRTAKYIGAYAAAMNGLDAIVFTAGIGENAHYIRSMICKNLAFIGVKINEKLNRKNAIMICDKSGEIYVFVIPTNEELLIAEEALKKSIKSADMI